MITHTKGKKKSGRVSKGTVVVEVKTFLHSDNLQEN